MDGLHSWMLWGAEGGEIGGTVSAHSPSSRAEASAHGEGRLHDGRSRAGAAGEGRSATSSGGAGASVSPGKPIPSLTNSRSARSIARQGSRRGAQAPGASASSHHMISKASEAIGDRDSSHHSATHHGKDSSYHASSHRSPIRQPSSISRGKSWEKEVRGAAGGQGRADAGSRRQEERRPAAKDEDMRKLAPSVSVCGSNSWGQCGQDQALNVSDPKEEKQAKQLAYGELPVYLLEGHREDDEEQDDWAPELAHVQLEDARVVWVSAGSATTTAMTDAGSILVWGDNTRGQLGRPTTTASCSHVPLKLPALRAGAGPLLRRGRSGAARPARHVSSGGEHSAAITVDGLMFVWGDNMSGQLGFQSTRGGWVRMCAEPADLGVIGGWEGGQKYRAVSCGADFTAAVVDEESIPGGEEGEEGVLYMFGRNDKGQCGLGSASATSPPTRPLLPTGHAVRVVACGGSHTVCACAGGDVYAWGANEHGQLGVGTCSAYRSEPCEVIGGLSGAGVMAISCGLFHSAAVTDGGLLFTWGDGSSGQLGLGPRVFGTAAPSVVESLSRSCVVQVSCGGSHSGCLTMDGRAYGWGIDARGRLGRPCTAEGIEWLPVALRMPENGGGRDVFFCGIALGEEHTVAMWLKGGSHKGLAELRCSALSGLCMGVRALRAMLRSYEIPAKVAASNSRPVLSREAARAGMTDSEKALAHVRSMMWDAATLWGEGGGEDAVGGVLVSHADGNRELIGYLDELPSRMSRVRKELRALRFNRFIHEQELEIRGQHSWALLEHEWVSDRDEVNNLANRLDGEEEGAPPPPQPPTEQGLARALVMSISPEMARKAAWEGKGGWETVSGPARIMSACAGVAPLILEIVNCLSIQHPSNADGGPDAPERPRPADEALIEPVAGHEPDASSGAAAAGGVDIVVEQGGFSTVAGLRAAFGQCVQHMGGLTSEKLAAGTSESRGIFSSGLVMYARNRMYRAWIAFACLVGLDAYGDSGNARLTAFFLWVFSVPFIIVQAATTIASNTLDPEGAALRWGVGGMVTVYIGSICAVVMRRALQVQRDAVQARRVVRVTRDNISNRIAMLCILIETWQLCSLAFGEGAPYDMAGYTFPPSSSSSLTPPPRFTLNSAMPLALADARMIVPAKTDSILGLSILVGVPIAWCIVRSAPSTLLLPDSSLYPVLSHVAVPLIASAFYMPILARVSSSITCSYSPKRSASFLDSTIHLLALGAQNIQGPCAPPGAPGGLPSSLPADYPPPRYRNSLISQDLMPVWGISGNGTVAVSLCSAIPCWDSLSGGGGILPHSSYALVGLIAFALYFPSAALYQEPDFLPDPALDILVASGFRAESQIAKALLLFSRELYQRSGWPVYTVGLIILSALLTRHVIVSPVSSPMASHLQRLGYSLAIWAHAASLLSYLLSSSQFDSLVYLVCGWGILIMFFAAIWPLFVRRLKRRVHSYIVRPTRKTTAVDPSGAAKRWWDISWVTGPRDEMVAPRVRIRAGEEDRDATATRRFFNGIGGKALHGGITAMSRVLGLDPPPPMAVITRTQRGNEQDERDAMVPQEPKWERSKYLNLSFQDLGTTYQRPEILNVMRGAHQTLVSLKLASNQLASFPRAGGSFPHLITLDISSNLLVSTSSLPGAPLLSALNLSSNLITASWRTVGPLSSYRRLKSLWVANNPVSDGDGQLYRDLVAWAVPKLVKLDGSAFTNPAMEMGGLAGIIARNVPPTFIPTWLGSTSEKDPFRQRTSRGDDSDQNQPRSRRVQEMHPYAVVEQHVRDERDAVMSRRRGRGRLLSDTSLQ